MLRWALIALALFPLLAQAATADRSVGKPSAQAYERQIEELSGEIDFLNVNLPAAALAEAIRGIALGELTEGLTFCQKTPVDVLEKLRKDPLEEQMRRLRYDLALRAKVVNMLQDTYPSEYQRFFFKGSCQSTLPPSRTKPAPRRRKQPSGAPRRGGAIGVSVWGIETKTAGGRSLGWGTGEVRASPPGARVANNGSDIAGNGGTGFYRSGASLTLTAVADMGSHFDHWSGACAGQGAACRLVVSGRAATTAYFAVTAYTLTVSNSTLDGWETGPGITCGQEGPGPPLTECSALEPAPKMPGQVITLAAFANQHGSPPYPVFESCQGCDSATPFGVGGEATLTVAMKSNRSITVNWRTTGVA